MNALRARRCAFGFTLIALSSVLLVSGCLAFQAGGRPGAQSGRFEFGLIGDQQYTAEDEAKFPNLINDLNDADLAFVVHNGDFKAGVTPCSDETFARRKEAFQTSKHPFIYTPGDNEWTDCHGRRAGGHDPLERLAKLRELFFQGDRSLGQRPLTLARQSNTPQYAKFRENVSWAYGDVLFVTLHMVGSNNNLGRTPQMDAEYAERNAANLAWMKQAFALARREGKKGLMIITQANPGFENKWDLRRLEIPFGPMGPMGRPPEQRKQTGFDDFLAALETETLAYGRPVVLVHGDTHIFRIDKPLVGTKSRRTVENFTRVETFGTPDVHWVRGIVDPNDPNIFGFKPEIVRKNLVNH